LLFDIKDGKLNTKPFDVTVGGIKMNLGGATGLDKSIAYLGKVQLPSSMNLGKFSTVGLKIGGTFMKPKIELDLASTLNSLVGDTKAKVTDEVNKKIDDTKAKAVEEARKQKDAALKAAQAKADQIRAQAQQLSDKLIAEAQSQGDQLVAKASNPITKKLAQISAKKIVDEATKKAADMNAKAEAEATKLIQSANGVNP